MTNVEFETLCKKAVDTITKDGYSIARRFQTAYPFEHYDTGEIYFSYALCFSIHNADSTKIYNTVVAYAGNDKWFVWCEDNFLEGGTTKTAPDMRIEKAVVDVHADWAEEMSENMRQAYGSVTASLSSKPGHFWSLWRSGRVCKHINHMLSKITESELEMLQQSYNTVMQPKNLTSEEKRSDFVAKVSKYSFKKHILVEGEKGSGKTFGLDRYVTAEGWHKEFIGGHEGIEAIDLLGHLVKCTEYIETGKFPIFLDRMVWKDGPLSAAFRKAAQGERVVLFIDEIFRIPSRELNILVAALTPNSKGQYVLRTGNIKRVVSDIAEEETIYADTGNLWVLATTNVGMGYQVDEIDEALADRFRIVRKDNDRNEIKAVLGDIIGTSSLEPAETIKNIMDFYDKFQDLRTRGAITKLLNLRHLCETVQFSSNSDDLIEYLYDLIPNWVARTPEGYLEEEQVRLIEDIITEAFCA